MKKRPMPLYDYVCRQCGLRYETLVRASAKPVCPQCGSVTLTRQVSAPSPPLRSKSLVAAARRQAAKEGHFSNFTAEEQRELLRRS
ncbi:FmdB family regulatory protein (plasmid) [Cupriavidus taiwanensis]|uniref:FmdB family regulatory protein n=2 Tax=Cupriavidus taiwanensis TaxID=164546 RepID=A0A375EEE4_9BURK|nr:FmdB family regulatory protein [Cupriavidus taiwanensis]SOZ74461.1 FmdB family regulatory protein [Cupriavidus taiwanensis]SPA11381.1 FmdB family regulatory protein [Cupriavidus taiwanensis]